MDDSDRLLAIQMLLHAQHLSLTAVYIYPCGQSASEKRQHYQHAKLLHGRCSEAGAFRGAVTSMATLALVKGSLMWLALTVCPLPRPLRVVVFIWLRLVCFMWGPCLDSSAELVCHESIRIEPQRWVQTQLQKQVWEDLRTFRPLLQMLFRLSIFAGV